MDSKSIILCIYLSIMLIGSAFGIKKYKQLNIESKIMLIYLILTVISESLVRVLGFYGFEHRFDYHIYSISSFFLILMMFVKIFHIKNDIIVICLISISLQTLETVNCRFFGQPITAFNTHILIIKSLVTIVLSLIFLYRAFIDDLKMQIIGEPGFWFTVLLLILYSSSLFFWACLRLVKNDPHFYLVQNTQGIINDVIYAGFASVFIFYPKRKLL